MKTLHALKMLGLIILLAFCLHEMGCPKPEEQKPLIRQNEPAKIDTVDSTTDNPEDCPAWTYGLRYNKNGALIGVDKICIGGNI